MLRFKALVHALAWVDDRLIVGTGPEGQLFEVREHGHETAPIAKLDSGQILSLLAEPDGTVLLGTGDPGHGRSARSRLRRRRDPLVSEIHDTKLVSRFGALSWRAERPAGTAIAFQARSGNVGEPDETWSAWSAEQTDPAKASTACPAGRFIQYRAKLSTTDPRHTPELRSVVAELSHGEPRAGNHPARNPRLERRRRGRQTDAAEHPLGRDRPQRRRPELHA